MGEKNNPGYSVDRNMKERIAKQMYPFDSMDVCNVGVTIDLEAVTET